MRTRSIVLAAACALLSEAASAEEARPAWQHTLAVYGMAGAISGDSQIGSLSVPVDISASDVLNNLKMGAMAAYKADNGTWSFTADTTYMDLGATEHFENSRKGEVDMKQLTTMLTAGRRVTDRLEALFGASYFSMKNEIALSGPLIGRRSASVDVDWIDPTIGFQFRQPIGERWAFSLRADFGGFGVGSQHMAHGLATMHFQQNERVSWIAGYRVIDFDYEEGDAGSSNYKRFDLTEQGPGLGIAIRL